MKTLLGHVDLDNPEELLKLSNQAIRAGYTESRGSLLDIRFINPRNKNYVILSTITGNCTGHSGRL